VPLHGRAAFFHGPGQGFCIVHRHSILFVASLILTGALGAYLCFPQLRLWTHAGALQQVPATQLVNAHTYDPEWFDAARAGRVDILQLLHDARYPVNTKNAAGYTAVIIAAYDEQPRALDYLLDAGADACLADHNGNTALMGAIYKGNTAIARRLLQTDCPIEQVNKAGDTALDFAVLFGRDALLHDLLARGASLNSRDAHGKTPIGIALEQGNDNMVRTLRSLGATE
jgi:uncharacterized protein